MHALEDNFKAIQAENYSLREYIIHLQSRLIESQGEYPQPPPNVNLNHPHARQHDHVQRGHDGPPLAPLAPMSQAHQLQASAARTLAAAGLNSSKHTQDDRGYEQHKRFKQDTAEESAAADALIRSQYVDRYSHFPSTPVIANKNIRNSI